MIYRKIVEVIVLLTVLVSLTVLIFGYDILFEKVISRGYVETEMWLERVKNGSYASSYYHIVNYLMETFNLTLPIIVNILALITLIVIFRHFNIGKSLVGLIYCFIVLNLFTILLIFSPGRTSITICLVFFLFLFSIPKIKIVPFSIISTLLFLFHLETLLIVFMLLIFRWFIFFIKTQIPNKFIKALLYLIFYSLLVFVLYLGLIADTSYATVVDDSGKLLNISFIIFTVFSVCFFCDKNYFILLSFLTIFLLFILGLNASYSYRVVILPILLGVYMEAFYTYKVEHNVK